MYKHYWQKRRAYYEAVKECTRAYLKISSGTTRADREQLAQEYQAAKVREAQAQADFNKAKDYLRKRGLIT